MIDLNEIEIAARKPWYCRSKQEDNLLRPDVLIELIARLREAEKDAERYRFMRDSGKFLETGSVFDSIVDQAMKEKCDE